MHQRGTAYLLEDSQHMRMKWKMSKSLRGKFGPLRVVSWLSKVLRSDTTDCVLHLY